MSQLFMFNLMEHFFNNVAEKLKVGTFLHAFCTWKFL